MSSRRHERTRARAQAVQVLYTSELQAYPPHRLLEEGLCLIEEGSFSDYALVLVSGVEEFLADVDACIEAASENWALERMPIVDRSILRVATYEMLYREDVPVSVSINEAVELAKSFGGEEDSPRFVNGVLGRIARMFEAGECALSGVTESKPVSSAGVVQPLHVAAAAVAIWAQTGRRAELFEPAASSVVE